MEGKTQMKRGAKSYLLLGLLELLYRKESDQLLRLNDVNSTDNSQH